jgi:deazaflavin-dependent oxidoreductase (nitroreductase family)
MATGSSWRARTVRRARPTMPELGATNTEVIAEFRANRGKVGGFFAQDSLLLLTTVGRKSGTPHTNPLSYVEDEGQLVVMGANINSTKTSDWLLNLVANPVVTVEVGDGRHRALATVLMGDRRARILERMRAAWDQSRREHPELPEMPAAPNGEIPVVGLTLLPDD